jgi:parallel beta helix pectate lyase-like protein
MRTIVVHPTDPQADAPSLTQAFMLATAGDTVLVGPGTYSPTHTAERLPLKIPPRVTVLGAGKETCILDGEGQFAPSFNPIRTDLSVVELADGVWVSGLTVTDGGGHGIGAPPGATVNISECVISRHGDHGLYLCGVAEAVVTDCEFYDNGLRRFEPALPRGVGARQGHHIFAEARHGRQNRLLVVGNRMRECFADGIAFVCFFSEPDAVSFRATVLRNEIEDSERGGLLFSGSFGPARNRLDIVAADNTFRGNKQFGISVLTAIPLAERVPQETTVTATISGNAISASPIGIQIQGAVGEALRNQCAVTLDRNRIADCGKNAIRLVGAIGGDGVRTEGNRVEASVSRNALSGGSPTVVLQGAGGTAKSTPQQNAVTARVVGNTGESPSEQAFVMSAGTAGNTVEIVAGSQGVTRKQGNLLT